MRLDRVLKYGGKITKLNGLNPQAYLRHVLERIDEHSVNRIAELLPCNVAAQIACDTAELRLAA